MTSKNIPLYVVIPAAGIGSRMQAEVPKQYLNIDNKTIIEHTLDCFLKLDNIEQVIVALSPDDTTFMSLSCAKHPKIKTVTGGHERSDSVLAALQAIDDEQTWVMVHDAARPCLETADIEKLIHSAAQQQGAILATRVRDTMKRSDANTTVIKTESRNNLWHALTPQCFSLAELKAAMCECEARGIQVTDEASAIEAVGGTVNLIEGCDRNIKVTRPNDLSLASFYLSQIRQKV